MSGSTSTTTTTTTSSSASSYADTSSTVTTILGEQCDLELTLGLTPNYDTKATLNAKYNVQASVTPSTHPVVKYFGVGIGGRKNVDSNSLTEAVQADAENMDLYGPIPIRCVPIDQDLSATQRLLYRMRVVQTFFGQQYVCYYLKLITLEDTTVEFTIQSGTDTTEQTYTLDYSNLSPTPPTVTADGTSTSVGFQINAKVNTNLLLLGSEIIESISVIKQGDLRYAVISEIGIYTGTDISVQTTDYTGAAFSYTESVMTQLYLHHTFNGTDMSNATKQFNGSYDFSSANLAVS